MQREATGIAECALGLHGLELAVAGIAAGVGPTANYVGRGSADLRSRCQQGQQEQQIRARLTQSQFSASSSLQEVESAARQHALGEW